MALGQNTVSADMLRGYVERIERLRIEKKQLSEDEAAILAEAKASGFTPSAIKACIKIRAMKPHDRQEAETILEMYLHSLGMAAEPPLFRAAGLASIDTTAREQVIDRMKEFAPANGLGDIIVNMGGKPVRLFRDKDGEVQTQDVAERAKGAAAPQRAPAAGKEPPPSLDANGAEALGRQYAKDNRAVIDNPFPFGDARRARFDEGWRKEAGSDGMGPDGGE